jgi:hypothetical protein
MAVAVSTVMPQIGSLAVVEEVVEEVFMIVLLSEGSLTEKRRRHSLALPKY